MSIFVECRMILLLKQQSWIVHPAEAQTNHCCIQKTKNIIQDPKKGFACVRAGRVSHQSVRLSVSQSSQSPHTPLIVASLLQYNILILLHSKHKALRSSDRKRNNGRVLHHPWTHWQNKNNKHNTRKTFQA